MKERTRISEILRMFADQVEDNEKLDDYKELELGAIYVWGTLPNGIQVPAIIHKSNKDKVNLEVPEIEGLDNG